MVKDLAKMIDHSLLHPTLTDREMEAGCRLAHAYQVASVCIKPYAVKSAATWLKDSEVLVGTVIGFPHGNSTTQIKVDETSRACQDGAVEIDMVVNVGKVLGEGWDFVEAEIAAIKEACDEHDAILKVIFENDFLPSDHFKIRLCEICSNIRVGFVKTSTGYGMVKGDDGRYGYQGATAHDVALMRKHCHPDVQIKAAGGVRSIDDMIAMRGLGATRIGASATKALIDAAIDRFGGEKPDLESEIKSIGY